MHLSHRAGAARRTEGAEPAVIVRILTHLGLPARAPPALTGSAHACAKRENCAPVRRFGPTQGLEKPRARVSFLANTARLTASRAGGMVAHGEKSGLNFLYTCIRLEFEKGSNMNSPIPPGAVAWTGETPASISRTLRTGLMTFFRIMWSPHGRGHGVLLLDRPMEEKGLAQLARSLQAGSPSTLR